VFQKAKEKGIGFVDAPVSGGQAGAVNGQLGIMCGGEAATFDKAKPVLDDLRQDVRADRRTGRRAAHQDGQPDLHRRHRRRAWREAVAFAKRNDLDVEKVISVISKGAASPGRWRIAGRQMNELKAKASASPPSGCART
jgi:3-hydroxyisobutyrate dehydrogenase-like beta-hydroxyacid dehydrogenase